jgi:predicted SAM-dependent methyltransferase
MKKFGKEWRVSFVGGVFHLPFRPRSFDVVFSQGLLEHFSNDEARQILREVSACSKAIIISVPSLNYPQHDLGDERLLVPEECGECCANLSLGSDITC